MTMNPKMKGFGYFFAIFSCRVKFMYDHNAISTADELSGDTDIDDLERHKPPKWGCNANVQRTFKE